MPIGRRDYLKYAGAAAGLTVSTESVVASSSSRQSGAADVVVTDLQTENVTELLGTEDADPELSWKLRASSRDVTQAAYRVLVASSPEKLANGVGDVWDSGKIASQSPRATYDGAPLESGVQYHWKVRVWSGDGATSDWSDPTWWEMGLLDADDWTADWIRYPPEDDDEFTDNQFRLVRHEFDLPDKSIARARAYVSASHQYQLHLNGETVDKGPSFHYPDRQYYKVKDVTELLESGGTNATAAIYNWNGPGQGRPESEPGLIVQLTVEYTDGSSDTVTTDSEWRAHDGPWLQTGDRNGDMGEPIEVIDGRKLPQGWTDTGFDDSDWVSPNVVGTHPVDPWTNLQSQERETVRNEPITPESVTEKTGGNIEIVNGYAQVTGGGFTLSEEGDGWSDYTYALDVRQPTDTDARPAAGFVFRAPDRDNGYMWQLGSEAGTGQLRLHVREDGEYDVLDTISVDAEPGKWYRVKVELSGTRIRTYFEGELVDERVDGTFSEGRVGFREASGEIGEFDNVTATAADGGVLLEDDFSSGLGAWQVPHVYVADFGEVVSGLPRIHFADGEAGRQVDMRAGYLLADEGTVAEERGTQNTNMRYGYVQRDGSQTFEPFLYLGFRYFQIEDPGEELAPEQITVATRYNQVPDERAATFSSSNETLDAVWELARHSALHGSQEQFVDTPTREKGQFLGDAFNISWTTMQAFGERKLSQQAIREFVDSQRRYWSETGRLNAVYPNGDGKRDIPDYTEKFPEWVWQYYLVTGDEELLADAYPVVQNVADYVARHIDSDTQLVTELSGGAGPYKYGIVDWPSQMRYGYDMDTVARTTVNALGANVFRRAAQMAAVLDKPDAEVAALREHEATVREGMNTHLLRDDGVYVDGLKSDGSTSSHVSQHANAFPLALGLVPEHAVESVADFAVSEGVQMGPMTVQWLLYGLDETNRYDALLDVMTNSDHPGWADILQRGGTFTWESWVAREHSTEQSLSHPWGATVLIGIQKAFLGVSIEAAGSSHVGVEPPSSALSAAKGRVPTERGVVDVAWERTETPEKARTTGGLVLSASIPANTTATVRIPTFGGDKVRVRESRKAVWNNGNVTRPNHAGISGIERDGGSIIVDVGSGEYEFELEQLGN